MIDEAPIGEKRRGLRRWKWIIPTLAALPVLAFLLSNLTLSTPWARRYLAGKIQNKTHLDTQIGSASWSPWNGISLGHVSLLQPPALRSPVPKPLAQITGIQLTPVWRAWLRGRWEVRSISLDEPRLTIPIELLAHLSQPQTSPTQPSPVPSPPVATVAAPEPNPPATAPPTSAVTLPKPAAVPTIPAQPTGWLRLKNASFALVSAGKTEPLLDISGFSGSLPIAGDPAQSVLKIGTITTAGNVAFANLSANLDWKFPILSLKPIELNLPDGKFLFAAKIASLTGLPLQIEAQVPVQPLRSTPLPFGAVAEAKSIAANAGFRGLLLAPSTWQGDFVSEVIEPSIKISGHEVKFDRGSSATILRGGMLSCVDARLIGDELSLLGNATIFSNGNAAANLRLVAPPESVVNIVKTAFPNIVDPSLTPLSTPQRSAFDLEAFGNISHPFLRFGKDGPIADLKPSPAPSN